MDLPLGGQSGVTNLRLGCWGSRGLKGPYARGVALSVEPRAVHYPYFTNDPIFRSCALKRASTRILGFADILEFVCGKMFPSDVGCD